jgi:hypothetical protein
MQYRDINASSWHLDLDSLEKEEKEILGEHKTAFCMRIMQWSCKSSL